MKCNPEKLVDAISRRMKYRDTISLIDSHMEIWDGTRVGDRIFVSDEAGSVWIVIGASWDNPEDLMDEYED